MVQEQCQPGHCEVVFRANLEMVGLEGLDRNFPGVPIAISVETPLTSPIPGRAVIERPSQRDLSSSRIVPQRARGHPMRNSPCMQSIHRV